MSEETKPAASLPAVASSDCSILHPMDHCERIKTMMPLAHEAKKILKIATTRGDTALLDCAVATLSAIIEAV